LANELKQSSSTGLVADAIVSVVHPFSTSKSGPDEYRLTPATDMQNFVKELRSLPGYCAQKDGRKWAALPVIILVSHIFSDCEISEPVDATLDEVRGDYSENIKEILEVVSRYWQRLLGELDNLGLMVTYEGGRYRVGPAFGPRNKPYEGELYYSPADRREGNKGKYFTVNRDLLGIQYEIELFEALINKPDVTELELQRFFEENTHFLASSKLAEPIPHIPLVDECGKLLIPDFVIKPIVAAQRDSNWEILELKHPRAKLLSGRSNHRHFSQEVMSAINQVKDYRDYFENPAHASSVAESLGYALRHPRLGVLIGRMPNGKETECLEDAQAREPQVRIVTYDEILETQKQLAMQRRQD
jgi:hypothetical protein